MCVTNHVRRVRTLYKSIMKLHRGLPAELQALGNNYAKGELISEVFCILINNTKSPDEFKRHKDLKTEAPEVTVFMFEWTVSIPM
jgi:Complex1_LYR-like